MFDKFGEFGSCEELNKAAAGFKAEGDIESLKALGKENGIDAEDVEDYLDEGTDSFATAAMAAVGRLNVEKEQTKDQAELLIIEMTMGMLTNPEIVTAVMKKGKRSAEILSAMRSGARKHKNGNVGIACGTDRQLQELIRIYYTETEKELEKAIEKLYE